MAGFAIFFMIVHLELDIQSQLIYLIYVYMFTCIFSCMGGAIACMAGFIFVESIYSKVKFD